MLKSSKLGRTVILVLLVLMAGVFVAKTWFVTYYRLPQNGMYPTIVKDGYLFAKPRPYKNVNAIKRGDVVIFTQEEQGERLVHIWRVIGLPGDLVQVLGATVSVNGDELKREEIRKEDKLTIYRERNGSAAYEVAIETPVPLFAPPARVTVPENEVFVLGDNRFDAQDSRYLGTVKFGNIIGRKL